MTPERGSTNVVGRHLGKSRQLKLTELNLVQIVDLVYHFGFKMSGKSSRKRGPAPVDEEELSQRRKKLKKKGNPEFVAPDLLDATSKFNFFLGRKAYLTVRGI